MLPQTAIRIIGGALVLQSLLFYAFAMQCMSTLPIVKKETNSWKWPSIQLFSMTIIAYFVSLLAYQLLK